jgi:hypothetical protein
MAGHTHETLRGHMISQYKRFWDLSMESIFTNSFPDNYIKMQRRSARELAKYLKTSTTNIAVIPLGIVVTMAVGKAVFQVSRNLVYHPEVKISVSDKSNLFGASSAEEMERRSKNHAFHAVRSAALASYHADLQRCRVEESHPTQRPIRRRK